MTSYSPCGHSLQTLSPGPEKVPLVQSTGSRPGSTHCFPAGHGKHTDEPLLLYSPDSQDVQLDSPYLLK